MFFHFGIPSIISLVTTYGYAVAFPLSFLLGPIIVVVAGLLVSLGYFQIVPMFFVLLAGDLIGDSICYFIGRKGGRHLTDRFGKHIGLTPEKIELLGQRFKAHDSKILLFGKTQVTGLPTGLAILFAAGIFKMPYKDFIWFNALGSVVKIVLLGAIGFYFGQGFLRTGGKALGSITTLFFVAAFLSIALPFVFKKNSVTKSDSQSGGLPKDS